MRTGKQGRLIIKSRIVASFSQFYALFLRYRDKKLSIDLRFKPSRYRNGKIPFTPESFADMQAGLYRLNDSDLQKEALLLSEDFLLWISRHFEIEVFLLEDLPNLGEALQLQLGWCMASSLLGLVEV